LLLSLFEVIIIRRRLSGMPSSIVGWRSALLWMLLFASYYTHTGQAGVRLVMRSFSGAVPRDALTVSPDCYVRESRYIVKELIAIQCHWL